MGNDASRTRLRAAADALLERDVEWEDPDFWNELWDNSVRAEDVFEAFSPDQVAKLVELRPKNLEHVCHLAVAQLIQFIEEPRPAYVDNALNCVRVLTRVMPVLLERGDDDEVINGIFWASKPLAGAPKGKEEDPLAILLVHVVLHLLFVPGFTIDDEAALEAEEANDAGEGETGEGENPDPNSDANPNPNPDADANPNPNPNPSPNPNPKPEPDGPLGLPLPQILWYPGAGADDAFPHGTEFDANRIDVLRLLVVILSEPVFQAPDQLATARLRWTKVATAMDQPAASWVFYSLLNTVLNYNPNSWVPYASALLPASQETLVDLCLQVLAIFLDFPGRDTADLPSGLASGESVDPNQEAKDAAASAAAPTPPAPSQPQSQGGVGLEQLRSENIFHHLVFLLRDEATFELIYAAAVRLLSNLYEANATYLPGSVTQIRCHQELLVLLWKLLEYNPAFEQYVINSGDVCKLVVPVCYMMFDARRDASRMGLVHLCTFLLLKLSGDREFAVALNKPFRVQLPVDMPLFTGSHGDLVLITLHKLIVNGHDGVRALHQCFLITAANISPYLKSLSIVTAVKVVNLFDMFTAPRFLYANEENHQHVTLLLDFFNNVVQYQYSGNPHLIYAMLKRKEVFLALKDLTLETALEAAKENRAQLAARLAKAHLRRRRRDSKAKVETQAAEPQRSDDENAPSKEGEPEAETKAEADEGKAEANQFDAGERAAALTFQPTADWLAKIKTELPLATIDCLLSSLDPKVEALCRRADGQIQESNIVDFLRDTTLVGLLPVPHSITIRKYQENNYVQGWFTAFLWGTVFVRNQKMPLFDGAKIKLFKVTTSLPEP